MILSVKEATERRDQTANHLKEHGILNYGFHVVDRHPTNGALGCLDGHIQIIEHAKEQGWPMVLILEDDIEIDTESLATHHPYDTEIPEEWGLLYLGGHCHDAERASTASPAFLLRVRDTLTTHAYLVRSTLYDVILEQRWIHHCAEFSTLRSDTTQQLQYPLSKTYWSPLRLMHTSLSRRPFSSQVDWSKRAIDIFYAHYVQPHYPCYMVYPMLVGQRAGQSLIETTSGGVGQLVDYTPIMKWKADVMSDPDRELVTIVLATEPVGHTWEVVADYIRMVMFPTRTIHLVITWVTSITPNAPVIQRYDRFTYGMTYSVMTHQMGWNDHLIVTHELFREGSRGLSLIDVSESVARHVWILTQPWIDCSFVTPPPHHLSIYLYRTRGVTRWTYDLAWFPLSWPTRFPCHTLCPRLAQPTSMPMNRPLFLLHFLLTFWKQQHVLAHTIVASLHVPIIPSSTWSILTWKPTTPLRPSLLNQLRETMARQLTTQRPHEFDSLVEPFEHLTR